MEHNLKGGLIKTEQMYVIGEQPPVTFLPVKAEEKPDCEKCPDCPGCPDQYEDYLS